MPIRATSWTKTCTDWVKCSSRRIILLILCHRWVLILRECSKVEMILSSNQFHLPLEHALIMERAWAPTMINQKMFQGQKVRLKITNEQFHGETWYMCLIHLLHPLVVHIHWLWLSLLNLRLQGWKGISSLSVRNLSAGQRIPNTLIAFHSLPSVPDNCSQHKARNFLTNSLNSSSGESFL